MARTPENSTAILRGMCCCCCEMEATGGIPQFNALQMNSLIFGGPYPGGSPNNVYGDMCSGTG